MPVLRTGIDMIEVDRIDAAIARHGDRFFQRFYTAQELAEAGGRTASLAARFAAKEATAKALGCGIGDVGWREIEVRRDERGRPGLMLHGAARRLADELGVHTWSLSLSHTHQHAIAMVVALGDD